MTRPLKEPAFSAKSANLYPFELSLVTLCRIASAALVDIDEPSLCCRRCGVRCRAC